MYRIFISSVQKEFEAERAAIKRWIEGDPVFRRFFEVFVFESDIPATDRATSAVYLREIYTSDIYLCLIGNDYGFEDAEGVSPTEREFDEATRLNRERLVFIKGFDDKARAPKEDAFRKKASEGLVRRRFRDADELRGLIEDSLAVFLVERGGIAAGAFDSQQHRSAGWEDLDEDRIRWFIRESQGLRNTRYSHPGDLKASLEQLELLAGGRITNAALLLFGKNPQRFFPSSEVKCCSWYGTERAKPFAALKMFQGNLFEMSDAAVDFVLERLDVWVGTHADGPAPYVLEIQKEIVQEAVINAIAHRDYASSASIQVELYKDRVEIFSPGPLNPQIACEDLSKVHRSYPNNWKIAHALYQVEYIEKMGTGTTDIIQRCSATGLPPPKFEATPHSFTITLFRPKRDKNGAWYPRQYEYMMEDKIQTGIVKRIGDGRADAAEGEAEKGGGKVAGRLPEGQIVKGYFNQKDVVDQWVADVRKLVEEAPQITQFRMAEILGVTRNQIRTALERLASESYGREDGGGNGGFGGGNGANGGNCGANGGNCGANDGGNGGNGGNRGANDGGNGGNCGGNGCGNPKGCENGDLRKRIVDLLWRDPGLSIIRLAAEIGCSKRTVERALKALKEEGRIRRRGATRGTWEVLES